MSEIGPSDAQLAFLYVSGEMSVAEAASFEQRLGEEQALRDSLCQAVELMRTLEGLAPPMPRPDYRQHVRQRLRPAGWWQRLMRRPNYYGHAALWSGCGAAAALVAVLTVSPSAQEMPPSAVPPSPAVAEQARPSQTDTPLHEPGDPATIEEAEMWANMPNSDHLTQTYEEEVRRRDRRWTPGERIPHLSE